MINSYIIFIFFIRSGCNNISDDSSSDVESLFNDSENESEDSYNDENLFFKVRKYKVYEHTVYLRT